MANRLRMATITAIECLLEQGWSQRRIARELGIDRETVSRYARSASPERAKPAISTAGSRPAGPAPVEGLRPVGRPSQCDPYRPLVESKLEAGLTAQRIWQDLRAEAGFAGSYESVKRFVHRLRGSHDLPFRRIESAPGAEAQVDFGRGGWIVGPACGEQGRTGGRKRRPHVLRVVLSYSGRAYSEGVWRQDTESFIRCLENAFRHFGGVPRTLVIDNLRAAVSRADWYDPELNPKLEEFARHYGTVILPTRPRTPRHKGKVESGIGYLAGNALKGHLFASLDAHNQHLRQWETQVADHRIHGTTRRQVRALFEEHERQALLPLPEQRFPCFVEARRKVHRDGHVEVERAYYSVPPEYLARQVWVRWDSRLVRIYNDRLEQIAVHCKAARGAFSTQRAHLASEKISRVERGADYLVDQARLIGPWSARWGRQMIEARGVAGIRVLQGLLALARQVPTAALENACQTAAKHQLWRLRHLRRLCQQHRQQPDLALLQEHPLIRPLEAYDAIAQFPAVSFRPPAPEPEIPSL
jgi:transposase